MDDRYALEISDTAITNSKGRKEEEEEDEEEAEVREEGFLLPGTVYLFWCDFSVGESEEKVVSGRV